MHGIPKIKHVESILQRRVNNHDLYDSVSLSQAPYMVFREQPCPMGLYL
jgi:hypothetical protein